jgi:hypothetical protein
MQNTGWDHALKGSGTARAWSGTPGRMLPRKLADQAGLTAALGPALARAGKSPLVDRGIALVSMAVAIALGATSMTGITMLAHHAPVLGAGPSDTTVQRTLEWPIRGPWTRSPGRGRRPGRTSGRGSRRGRAARPVRLRGPQRRRAGHAALPALEPARPACRYPPFRSERDAGLADVRWISSVLTGRWRSGF